MESHANGTGEDTLAGAIESIAATYQRIGSRVDELGGQLALARQEQAQLGKALRALAPEHPALPVARGPKGKAKAAAKDNYTWAPTLERQAAAWAWIRGRGDEPFALRDLAEAVADDMGPDTARRCLIELRKAEAVRLAGKAGRGGATVYRLLDVEAGDRLFS